MDYNRIREIVNKLACKLIEKGYSKSDIIELLELDDFDMYYFDLRWLEEEVK